MKGSLILLLFSLALGFSCSGPQKPDKVFNLTKEKILTANRLALNQSMVWEDPNW